MSLQNNLYSTLIELIQLSVGKRKHLSKTPTAEEWNEIIDIVRRQCIMGVIFDGVSALSPEQAPPKDLLLRWASTIVNIEKKNRKYDKICKSLTQRFEKDGKSSIILKGQAIAKYYDIPNHRMVGDIDVWLGYNRTDIINYACKTKKPKCIFINHLDFNIIKDVCIELHFSPSYTINPLRNMRLQRWYKQAWDKELKKSRRNKEDFPTPSIEFNAVFILQHIFKHYLSEGVGLRHIWDYYYVLKRLPMDMHNEVKKELKYLHLEEFASGIMWIMKEIFLMDDNELLFKPSAHSGEKIFNEILSGANFGRNNGFDEKVSIARNKIERFLIKERFYLSKIRQYPAELIWSPFLQISTSAWVRFFSWKYKL